LSLSKLDGVAQVSVNEERGSIRASFDKSIYPMDAIYGSAYIFIDRCYVFLDAESNGRIAVELRNRKKSKTSLEDMVGEFANELLSQSWRQRITDQNRLIIEAVTAQAFRGASGAAPALSELDDLDFTDDAFEDPLGISLSWEEKYGKEPAGPAVEGKPMGPLPPTQSGPPKRPEQKKPEGQSDE